MPKTSSKGSSSTLSLHIAAYENSVANNSMDKETSSSKKQPTKEITSMFDKLRLGLISPFEIPRQQREQSQEPEIMGYRTSQQLLNPNETQASTYNDRRIPLHKRLQLMTLLNSGESISSAARTVKISTFGARYTRDRVLATNHLSNRPIANRVLVDYPVNSFIMEQMKINRKITTRELHDLLTQNGLELSASQLRYRIKALGYTWRKMKRVQVIAFANQLKRLAARSFWESQEYPFHRYLFVDECTVVMGRTQQWCWVQKGEKVPCQGRVRHGEGYHIFGGISWNGATQLMIWKSKHRMNSTFYCSNNLTEVVAKARPLFRGGDFELIQDNHPSHVSGDTLQFLKEMGIPTFDWPPQSPDWNAIEFVWRDLKEYIASRAPTSLDELHTLIDDFWSTVVTPPYCRKVIRLAIRNIKRSFDGLNHEKDFARDTVYQK